MPPAQAGTALAERAGEAGHHERDRGAAGHPHRSTTPRSRMEGHTTVPELGHGSPLRLENGIGVGRGGARGAYQAGVLQGLAEIVGERFGDRPPFDVVTGISAGAINAAYLASRADRMAEASAGLAALWGELRIDRVMRTDAVSLFSIGSRWLRDLTLGGLLKPDARSNHLLDTAPLGSFSSRTSISRRSRVTSRATSCTASPCPRRATRPAPPSPSSTDTTRPSPGPGALGSAGGRGSASITSWPRPPFPFCSDRSSSRGRSTATAASARRRHSARRSISEPTESSPSPCAIRPTGTQTYT